MSKVRAKKRRGLRPLSQTGFPRVPMNPRQRNIDPQTAHPFKRNAIDAINEDLASLPKPLRLHPTKGYRRLNAKNDMIAMITAAMRRGVHYSSADIKRELGWISR